MSGKDNLAVNMYYALLEYRLPIGRDNIVRGMKKHLARPDHRAATVLVCLGQVKHPAEHNENVYADIFKYEVRHTVNQFVEQIRKFMKI